ncbi:sensor histidine kinase [Streptomyces hilarionis]|uniref:sensor histidine kinase n=1 Tax=Streptomyces hilarionis TaxID=2839954 RepID=UPI00211A9C5E|nr:sensor domain-containing protein [Streptomyces hilarionis]MCQ9131562.1 sensor domain-containing protein [Streptomyces hilarionis]
MHPPTVWQALSRPGYLLSPWRAAAYLLTGAAGGAVVLAALTVWAVAAGVLAVVLVGLPLLAALAFAGLPVAALERRRLRWVDPAPAPTAHGEPGAPGVRARLAARLRARATWRELAHTLLAAGLLWPAEAFVLAVALVLPLAMTATPLLLATVGGGREIKVAKLWTVTGQGAAFGSAALGVLLLAAGAYALGAAAGARAALTRRLVCPREGGPQARVVELTRSRARLVDAFEAERRRIERDLHDGAQQRLVALTMALGLARLDAPPGTRLAEQLARAQEEAGAALAELRELIHGIHPQVLADHGLAAALADAADRSPVPVDVECELPTERLPQAVEAAAHFVVREALANVARHSGARRACVRARLHEGRLLALEVGDDGRGGADPSRGTGLTGLADRVSVLDGTLSVTSPAGGPTLLRVEIPCEPMPTPTPPTSATALPTPTEADRDRDGGEGCASSSPRTASSSATA